MTLSRRNMLKVTAAGLAALPLAGGQGRAGGTDAPAPAATPPIQLPPLPSAE